MRSRKTSRSVLRPTVRSRVGLALLNKIASVGDRPGRTCDRRVRVCKPPSEQSPRVLGAAAAADQVVCRSVDSPPEESVAHRNQDSELQFEYEKRMYFATI